VSSYFRRSGPAISAADIRGSLEALPQAENGTRLITIDLTQARSDTPLGVSGSSITILDTGGADWSFRLAPTANHPDAFPIAYFVPGVVLEFEFDDILVSNAAAAPGTAPAVLLIGRRV